MKAVCYKPLRFLISLLLRIQQAYPELDCGISWRKDRNRRKHLLKNPLTLNPKYRNRRKHIPKQTLYPKHILGTQSLSRAVKPSGRTCMCRGITFPRRPCIALDPSESLIAEIRILLMAAKKRPNALFCKQNRTECIPLVSVMSDDAQLRSGRTVDARPKP
jgi:hypothetical protein